MNQQLLNHVEKSHLKNTPDIKPGQTVRVHQKIKEGNKERVQIFEGLVIQVGGGTGVNSTFTVRKVVSGVGVEKIFPIHSSNIVKIEIVKQAKIRRAKLFFMRDRSGKSARLRETHVNETTEIDTLHKDEPATEVAEDASEVMNSEEPAAEENTDSNEVEANEASEDVSEEPTTVEIAEEESEDKA